MSSWKNATVSRTTTEAVVSTLTDVFKSVCRQILSTQYHHDHADMKLHRREEGRVQRWPWLPMSTEYTYNNIVYRVLIGRNVDIRDE